MRFEDLSPDGQVALAAWAVLTKSAPLDQNELSEFPDGFNHAVAGICTTVGLRTARRFRYHQLNMPYDPRKTLRPTKARRPIKQKVTAR